ncbi:uncharacterized protein LOC11175695 [Anopheles gambiae]|uniref:uncharacterized protein LOC11175695 n=1 Tax=Anopheles gambiae TaxID=7165 RepID=UPI002AC9A872|nr:uncharacterized protein LOC11175695 [Anopheles gambiae]
MELSVEPSVASYDAGPGLPFADQPPYSLMVLIKLLELNSGSDEPEEQQQQYTLSLQCGKEKDDAVGTLTMLNTIKPGIVVSLQEDAEKFARFLTDSTVEVAIKPNDSPHSYRGVLQLKDTKVMAFDPTADSGTPVAEQFPLHDASSSKQVGMVSMVLQVVRSVAPVDPLASFDVLYRINDSKLKSADRQEAEVRQLLACPKCSLPRANGDSCCGYEIVDGILSKKMVSSTEQMIERIKEKINQVKLDDAIGQRDSVSDTDGCGKFCAQCGGLTITGATCASSVANVRPGRARSSHTVAENRADEGLACGKDLSGRKSIKKTTKSSIRCCERCKACLDWLPEACCCPKCGYKPKKQASRSRFSLPAYFNAPSVAIDQHRPDEQDSSLRGSDTMVASSDSCRLCNICKTRCIDCANQISQQGDRTSTSSFSTGPRQSKHITQVHRRSTVANVAAARPMTRRPWRTEREAKASGSAVGLDNGQGKRKEQMQQVYGSKGQQDLKSGHNTAVNANVKQRPTAKQIRKQYNATVRKIKHQNRNLYSYRFGKRHPGIVVGHRTCMKRDPLVPAHMGWQWDVCPPGIGKRRPGWRPGAVRRPIMQLMQHFLKCYPLDNVPVTKRKSVGFQGAEREEDGDKKQRPTLHITRKHGEYAITMHPLKDSATLQTTDDPYLPCKPIKFKLAKDPQRTKLYLLRDALKRKGLPLCGCKELTDCGHCTEREKRLLAEEIRRSSKVLGLSAKTSIADIPSGSESELDVEFTPPSAIIRPDMKRPDVVVAETQYNVQDFQLKPVGDEKDGKGKAAAAAGRGHGKGDGAGSKSTNQKGAAGSKKGAAGGPDAGGTKVRISVTKAKGAAGKGPGGGAAKGNEPGGRGNKNASRPSQQGAGAVGEGAGSRPNQRAANGKGPGDGHGTKVNVQQRSALSRGKQIGMDSSLVCDRIPQAVPQSLMVGCCPTVAYCCYPTQCLP